MPADLIVIGSGSAGLVAARTGAALGARVTLVEAERIGGDCTWTGCIPSKALIHEAAGAPRVRPAEDPAAEGALARVRQVIQGVYERESPEELARAGIEVVVGTARFRDRTSLEVAGNILRARRLVVCTGAAPAPPTIEGLADTDYLTYRNVFDLVRVPSSLIILGGGAVGVELAQTFSRLGSEVTLLEAGTRLLAAADPEASGLIAEILAGEGIRVRLDVTVERVRPRAHGVLVEAGRGSFEAERLLVATGRRAYTGELGLEAAGVRTNGGAIDVDHRLRTSAPGIYAAGDVTGGRQFTHLAGWQGYAAARNALLPGSEPGLRPGLPWAIFTDPAVAQVGLSLEAARARHPDAAEHRLGLERVDRAATDGTPRGFLKLVSDGRGKVLGASIVSPSAGELINELSLAIALGASVSDLARTIHVYPTYGTGLQELAAGIGLRQAMAGWKGALLRRLTRGRDR